MEERSKTGQRMPPQKPSEDRAARAARHITETFLVAAVLTGLQLVDFLAPQPVWMPAVLVFAGSFAMVGASQLWPRPAAPLDLHLRLAVQTSAITAVAYSIGWGPAVAVVLGFGIADSMKLSGSRAARPGLAWACTGIAVGQFLIGAEVAPTLVPEPAVHGLAVIAALGLTFVVHRFEQLAEAREAVEESLRLREEHFRRLVQNSSDVILVVDEDAKLTYASPSLERVFGHPQGNVLGTPLRELVHVDDRDELGTWLRGLWASPGDTRAHECRWRHSDGSWRYVETVGTNLLEDGELEGVVLNLRDVTDRTTLEQQLQHRAFHDPLTELANRALFQDRVELAVARNARSNRPFAVLFIDLDGFKRINDSFGHAAGDALLQTVAERIRGSLRDSDTAARFGGDEFAILIEELADDSSAARVTRRLLDAIRGDFRVSDGSVVHTDASVGIAVSTGTESAEEMLRNADIAMYMAKGRGKGCFEIFEPDMHTAVVTRLNLEAELATAIDHGDLVLHYQPIVDLETGRLSTVEALVRWNHPTRGLVSPGDFIPLAEETGLIVPLGEWVLREACQQMRTWQQRFPKHPRVGVSVNLSPTQIAHPALVTEVADALATSGLPAETLILEITESALVIDSATTRDVLHKLKRLGVKLAIDDFGTGYSSLGYLQRFPLDVLKIDRSFVDRIDADNSSDPALVRAIVNIGLSLNLQTVAEGIERSSQLAQFRNLHCHLGQGFLFAHPADPETIEELFIDESWQSLAGMRELAGLGDVELEELLTADGVEPERRN